MAELKIREGSLILELYDGNPPTCIWSKAFPNLTWDNLDVSVWEQGANAGTYKQGKLNKKPGKKHAATVKKN